MRRLYPAVPPLLAAALLTVSIPVSFASVVPLAQVMEKEMEAKTEKIVLPRTRPLPPAPVPVADGNAPEKKALPETDAGETAALPSSPPGARIALGKPQTYSVGEEDTLLDVARHFRLGFVEIRAANPKVDPWTPVPGEQIVIPSFRLLPRARQEGIVVNLAQMRLYYFEGPEKDPVTFPIGIGREGLQTPTGETTVIRKTADPVWRPTERMLEEKPWLPAAVPAGPSNPLGTHALYLGWPTFLIHGSNKPWAIGRRVSSGCMRMYPEDIIELFNKVPVGTKVTVVDQPILVGRVGDDVYLEANPSRSQSGEIEIGGSHALEGMSGTLKKAIIAAAGIPEGRIDWDIVEKAVEERLGYPVIIDRKPEPEKKKPEPGGFNYN
ncbi:MAG: L,D-transpeptidase family protein [Pseudomonadota bacterium]